MTRRSVTARAASVVALAVGFWALAAGLEALLVVGGWGIVRYAPDDAAAGFLAWGLAAALAYGFLPRWRAKGEASELPVGPGEQPRLHAFVRDVAERAGGRIPDSLYLFHEANAFAGARTDGLLARRRAVVGLGLPLLAVLDEHEMRSVLAHEMGHHIGGDVTLGPWIHRTRGAIARAVDRLDGSSFWLHLPFMAYATLFLRLSTRISREQELQADAVAARVAGVSPAASALRKIEVLSAAWSAYFESEVVPVLAKGRLPPLLEGYERYWHVAQMPDTPAHGSLSMALEVSRFAGEHDTHPVLAERLAALGDPPAVSARVVPALSLLDDVPRIEERVLRDILRDRNAKLTPIAWDATADEVWLPIWRDAVADAGALRSLTAAGLPSALEGWAALADATRRGPAISSPAAERKRVTRLLGAWLAVRLSAVGFRVSTAPGMAVRAMREEKDLEPFALVSDLAARKLDAARWSQLCVEHGLDTRTDN